MSNWPSPSLPPLVTLHPWAAESLGNIPATLVSGIKDSGVSTAWFSANLALYVPFWIWTPTTVKIGWTRNGATATGNIDIGIYTRDGVRIVSMGSTAQSGTSTLQTFNITDTLLMPGPYFMALATNSGSTTLGMSNAFTAPQQKLLGIYEQASAFPLPATATFATPATVTRIPAFGFSTQGTI